VVVVDDVLVPPSLRTIIDELDFAYWWPTEIGWRRASGAFKRGVTIDITTDAKESRSHTQPESEEIMIHHPLQRRAYDAVTPALLAATTPQEFTVRQREIISLAAQGLSNKEIADRLTMSIRSVEGHLFRASQRVRANNANS
jgi:DNA-binding NarL/FixJ family response regulator